MLQNTTVKRNRLQNILITEGCRPTLKANHIDRIKVEISARRLHTNIESDQIGLIDDALPSSSYGDLVYYKSNYKDREGDTSNLVVVTISPHWIEPTIDDEEFRLHGESDIEIDSDDYYESD